MTKNWSDWMKKYYPVSAQALVGMGKTPLELVEASILKWEGLKAEVLAEHNMIKVLNQVGYMVDSSDLGLDDEPMYILRNTEQSCTLCVAYRKEMHRWCGDCPLVLIRRGVRCDRPMAHEEASPYEIWFVTGDAKPMLRWLKKTRSVMKKAQNA